jgi:glyoxylase-like metal-dependent hydrolase (beta-lactamase superfamily II)
MAKIHHLNCATMCPYNARLMDGQGGWTEKAHLIAHVLVIESDDGLVLVDTGLGTADVADPPRTGGFFRHIVRPEYEISETAVERLGALGFKPADVRHIVLTHLDVDHAGGLGDFPRAKVHVFRTEMDAALNPGLREKLRYIQAQWAHGPNWVPYETEGDSWFGFESVRAIEGLDTEIAIVPLVGHSRGHSAIAVRGEEGWLLHAGDGYFHRDEMRTPPNGPAGLRFFQTAVELDGRARRDNQERLRRLVAEHSDEVRVFCSHDRVELERLSAGS